MIRRKVRTKESTRCWSSASCGIRSNVFCLARFADRQSVSVHAIELICFIKVFTERNWACCVQRIVQEKSMSAFFFILAFLSIWLYFIHSLPCSLTFLMLMQFMGWNTRTTSRQYAEWKAAAFCVLVIYNWIFSSSTSSEIFSFLILWCGSQFQISMLFRRTTCNQPSDRAMHFYGFKMKATEREKERGEKKKRERVREGRSQ